MDWSGIALVSWDLDGTLYDSESFWRAFRRRVWAQLRPGRFWRTLSELWLLRSYRRWVAACRSEGGAIEEIPARYCGEEAEEILDRWISAPVREAGASPGVRELMSELARRGIAQVVVTDLRCFGKLHALGLPSCIDEVFEGESLGWIKPHAALFSAVLKTRGLPSNAVLHIGDRVDTDRPAAEAHGIQCLIRGHDFSDYAGLKATLPPISG
jgi:FMN phosphatase YigB (HAD superfamily)